MVWSPSLSAFFPYTTLFRSPPLPAFVDHLLSNYPLCGLIERLLRRFLAYFACFFTPFLQRLLHLHARHLGEFFGFIGQLPARFFPGRRRDQYPDSNSQP